MKILKKLLMVLGVVILLLFLVGAFLVYYFSPDENKVLDFIRNNPEESRNYLNEVLALLPERSASLMW
ncbi:MAG: hypothetical protein N2044_00855 [Cyclobacteriaceae bacterium]|nr:hypothetical protein [Cyclobacteriaceae bacterium]